MKISKIRANMQLPEINFECFNTKDREGVLTIRFGQPGNNKKPWIELTFNKPFPNVIVNAFNRYKGIDAVGAIMNKEPILIEEDVSPGG